MSQIAPEGAAAAAAAGAGSAAVIPVRSSAGEYSIFVGRGLLQSLPARLSSLVPKAGRFIVITDSNMESIYGDQLRQNFDAFSAAQIAQQADSPGLHVHAPTLFHVVPAGEASKSRDVKRSIEDWMLSSGCLRDACVVAVGGGVVGDLAGFVAASFMRGVAFVQVPTSLLAMVDSSIGGKTGVDTPHGKNLVGAFHAPRGVIIDLEFLQTLPSRELCNGMAEIIKGAAIADAELFSLLEQHCDDIIRVDLDILFKVVKTAAAIKADVVSNDEKEGGIRAILNFGHSVGHSVEALCQPALLHGECVAIGMIVESMLARSLGLLSTAAIRRLDECCRSFKLPTVIPPHLATLDMFSKMAVDKKNASASAGSRSRGPTKRIVMLSEIGKVARSPASSPGGSPGWMFRVQDEDLLRVLCPAASVIPGVVPNDCQVNVPGSKSISNRILLLAAMGRGECRVRGLLHSEDTQVMLASLRLLGVEFHWEDQQSTLVLQGAAGQLSPPARPLYLNNAGTASRFLTTLCCALNCPEGASMDLTGNPRMHQRPIGDLVDALRASGCDIQYLGESAGSLPIRISTPAGGSGWAGGRVSLAASVSSQFVSSVLLSAPLAAAPVVLALDTSNGPIVSRPYIDLTIDIMKQFGIVVDQDPDGVTFRIPHGVWDNPPEITVEGDASSATYPLSIAAVTGGSITVTNVGSRSLQGDAQFAKLLERMGCTIEQTETTTTVVGPQADGRHLRAIDVPIDMDSMTDSFMTLAAVASVAHGTTRIVNIANQRVKECNRIAATVQGLASCGIVARELETGIEVEGRPDILSPLSESKSEDSSEARLIDCHHDHRLAMSFAVLGSVLSNVVLDSKQCVDKTYPEFWDMLHTNLGLTLSSETYRCISPSFPLSRFLEASLANSLNSSSTAVGSVKTAGRAANASIILVGMRGAGKSTLGAVAARVLGWKFIDVDAEIESYIQNLTFENGASPKTIKELISVSSWEEFRRIECLVFKNLVADHPCDSVIACGGGIVETPSAVDLLKNVGSNFRVVQVSRHIDDIISYLEPKSSSNEGDDEKGDTTEDGDNVRPAYTESILDVWLRRKPLFWDVATFEFCINAGDNDWSLIERDWIAFLRRVLCVGVHGARKDRSPLGSGPGTYFLSLTFPTIDEAIPLLDQVSEGVDALELRVDLLQDTSPDSVRSAVTTLRRHSSLPIIFTVRSQGQGGKYPDADVEQMFHLNQLAVRMGCEWVDVESHWDSSLRLGLLAASPRLRGVSRFICSDHQPRSHGGSPQDITHLLNHVWSWGLADVVKIVTRSRVSGDAMNLLAAVSNWKLADSSRPPVIALAMGAEGQLSRVLNHFMTPVTHPMLPVSAAPGQMSVKDIEQARMLLGCTGQRTQVYLFGTPISLSPSPAMHNAGFAWAQLPYKYSLCETTDLEQIQKVVSASDFLGASVTIPLKTQIIPLLDRLTLAAQVVGAVNTVITLSAGTPLSVVDKLFSDDSADERKQLFEQIESLQAGECVKVGHNTDWQGIAGPVRELLPASCVGGAQDIALVIGAGGTARAAVYAMKSLGFNASSILVINPRTPGNAAALAEEFKVGSCASANLADIHQVIPAGIVRAVVCTLPGAAQWKLPLEYLEQHRPFVVLDASYLPVTGTDLTKQAQVAGLPVVRGIDMLVAQGLEQFDSWMGANSRKSWGAAASMDSASRLYYNSLQSK